MVGQEIQYAATYKGVKDIATIIKYAGQNDNGIFTKWLDHLLMYFQLNQMCGPDNELVRLLAMYNSLEGVVEEWYRDLILHAPKRSWTFEKAVCGLFLTYVFGSAASHAGREFNEVQHSRTEGAREYAQRLKTKAQRLARKPDESTMVIRSLAGLPTDLSRRLTLWERLDPTKHRFKHFMAKLHELGEAENMARTVNAAVMDEQRKTDPGITETEQTSVRQQEPSLYGPEPAVATTEYLTTSRGEAKGPPGEGERAVAECGVLPFSGGGTPCK